MKYLGYAAAFGLLGGFSYLCLGGIGLVIAAFAVLVWGLLVCEDKGRQL